MGRYWIRAFSGTLLPLRTSLPQNVQNESAQLQCAKPPNPNSLNPQSPPHSLTHLLTHTHAQDLREESAKLQKEAGAFKIEASDFDMLAEVAEDVAATKVSWDRYGAFLAERDEMANKDWLSMRDQVGKGMVCAITPVHQS